MRVTVLALALVACCASACSTGIDGTPRPTPPPAAVPGSGPSQVPGDLLDLADWYLTLPTGKQGDPDTVENPELATNAFFQVDAGAAGSCSPPAATASPRRTATTRARSCGR